MLPAHSCCSISVQKPQTSKGTEHLLLSPLLSIYKHSCSSTERQSNGTFGAKQAPKYCNMLVQITNLLSQTEHTFTERFLQKKLLERYVEIFLQKKSRSVEIQVGKTRDDMNRYQHRYSYFLFLNRNDWIVVLHCYIPEG